MRNHRQDEEQSLETRKLFFTHELESVQLPPIGAGDGHVLRSTTYLGRY